jgi:hypothetical protein
MRVMQRRAPNEQLDSLVSDLERRIKLRSVGWEVTADKAFAAARDASNAASEDDPDVVRFVRSIASAISYLHDVLVTSEGEGLRTIPKPLVCERDDEDVQSVADAVHRVRLAELQVVQGQRGNRGLTLFGLAVANALHTILSSVFGEDAGEDGPLAEDVAEAREALGDLDGHLDAGSHLGGIRERDGGRTMTLLAEVLLLVTRLPIEATEDQWADPDLIGEGDKQTMESEQTADSA